MEPSDSIEYYQLKDRLTEILKDEISRSLTNERDLQQRYIGVGLKIAAAGIAAAVLTLGVFGIKSFAEVDSAIKKIPEVINAHVSDEIEKRFNNNNPVAQYEAMLRESAARSIATSLTIQADRGSIISLDERISGLVVQTISDSATRLATKLSLIDALATPKIRIISPAIDQAVIAFTLQLSKDPSINERSLRRCLSYFSVRSPERYVTNVEKIFDEHTGMTELRLAIARYTLALSKDYGDNLAIRLRKLEDPDIGYLLHVRDLTLGRTKEPNHDLLRSILDRALKNSDPNDGITFFDIIDNAASLDDNIGAQLAEVIREYANEQKLTLAVADDSSDDMSFNFYSSDRKRAGAGIDQDHYQTLMKLALSRLRSDLQQSKGEFTDAIMNAMEFWLPRSDPDAGINSRKAGAYELNEIKKMRFLAVDGHEVQGDTLGRRAFLSVQRSSGKSSVALKWLNEMGISQSMQIRAIADLDTDSLSAYGIWNHVSSNDD